MVNSSSNSNSIGSRLDVVKVIANLEDLFENGVINEYERVRQLDRELGTVDSRLQRVFTSGIDKIKHDELVADAERQRVVGFIVLRAWEAELATLLELGRDARCGRSSGMAA